MVDDYGEELDDEIIRDGNNYLNPNSMLNVGGAPNTNSSSGLVHYTNHHTHTKESNSSNIIDESEPHRAQKSPTHGSHST